jgi:hypothetical protein
VLLLGSARFEHRYINRLDNLVAASTCTTVGTASIDCQIHLVADVGIFEMYPLEGEKQRERVDWLSSIQTGHSGAANQC